MKSLRPNIAAAQDALHRFGLPQLLDWWLEQLRLLLPSRLLRLAGFQRGRLQCRPLADGGFQIGLRRPGENPLEIGRLSPGAGREQLESLLQARVQGRPRTGVELILPADACFCRPVTLPLATEANLGQVLRYEMDRHTPFPANRVYHAWEVLRRDAGAGRLQVALVVVPRERVDEPLAQLRTLGLEVRRAIPEQLPLEQAQSRWFNLLPRDETGAGRPRPGRAQLAVASLVAALLVTLLLPLWQHRAISIQYLDELRALAPQVSRLSAAQDRREQLREALEAPLRAREAQVPATELLAEITRLLPDHTWLASLRLEGRELHLEGDSAAASALIEALEDSPLLTNVRFLASVQRRGDGRERFTLGAEALPAAAEETP